MNTPHVEPGKPLGRQVTASEWNALFQEVQRIKSAVFGGGATGFNLPGGRVVTTPPEVTRTRPFEKTVCVIETPNAAVPTIKVRPVRYKDPRPPRPCETVGEVTTCYIEFTGELIEAFPDFGFGVMDYEDFVVGETDTLDDETPYLRARYEEGQWIVENRPVAEGGGGIRPAKVVSASGTASTIVVQPVKRSGTSWVNDGGQITVPLWGGQQGQDFATLIQNGPDATADYIPLVQFEGEWYAMQYFWLFAKTPLSTIARGDCGL